LKEASSPIARIVRFMAWVRLRKLFLRIYNDFFDSFETDRSEIDPISEADVYLAYGRYQQAEGLIRHDKDQRIK
jgi:hypothetical protein